VSEGTIMTTYAILEERANGALSYVRIYDNSSMTTGASSFPEEDRFTSREAADANTELLRADNARRVEQTKRWRKYRTLPATYTVIECTPENEAAIRQRWIDGAKRVGSAA
jgi:hypothetical protein